MNQTFCRGCGSELQTVDPSAPGYVPPGTIQKRKQLICQRCYRIIHYGAVGSAQPEKTQIAKDLTKAIGLSQLLVVVADFSDLTGTLPIWSAYLGKKPFILAVNKSDLLPAPAKLEEVKTYLESYLQAHRLLKAERTILVSALAGEGTATLKEEIKKVTSCGAKVAFLGVTNVGKSSLIKRFLQSETAGQLPTVSKIPGTTMGLSNWSIFKGRNTLIDTPGLVSEERISDLVCPECGSRLVATGKLNRKLWGIKPGKGLIVGGLLAMESLGDTPTVLIAFTAPAVLTHRTDAAKVSEILKANPDWLQGLCTHCFRKISFREQLVELKPGMDLAVAGLGWVSLRGKATRFKIILPEGVRWEVRPALIGRRPE